MDVGFVREVAHGWQVLGSLLNKGRGAQSSPPASGNEVDNMKTTLIAATVTAALALGALTPEVRAGDREWAVAGKVLTGVVAAGVVARALDPAPCAPTTAVVYAPPVYVAATPVVAPAPVAPPAPVYYAPAPAPVYYAPAPAPTVVYYAPPPAVVVSPAPYYMPAPRPVVIHGHPRRFRGHAHFCW